MRDISHLKELIDPPSTSAATKTKVRRVYSSDPGKDAPLEELDEKTGDWHERGSLVEGEEVEMIGEE